MIKDGNTLIAEEGKCLIYRGTSHKTLTIEGQYILIDGKVQFILIDESEVTECYPVLIYNDVYYISSTEKDKIISELIRKKYSIDDELALIANARLGKGLDEEEAFQNWRKVCKETAKRLTNE